MPRAPPSRPLADAPFTPTAGHAPTATSGLPVAFGRYVLVRRIGIGGMGEVFLAREETPDGTRTCVVKKVLPHLAAQPAFVRRFRDEARLAVRLRHPHIARVHAMGEVEGELFLAMEYVQGKTLSRFGQRLRERGTPLPLGLVLLVGERVCEGLASAHAATDEEGRPLHLVHRDLSPANVCVSYRGEVKIIDFGAARTTLKESQTAPRAVIGNLTYMPPEQARKQWVDGRADVYALGAVLWELVAHRMLPQGGTPIERWERAVKPRWEPPGRLRPGVPAAVDAVLLRALAADPEERFPDAASFGAALAELRRRLGLTDTEEALGHALSEAFPRERLAEEAVLARLSGGTGTRVSVQDEADAVSPVALAFEHNLTEVVPEPPLTREPGDDEETEPDVLALMRPPGSRVGFGAVLTGRGGAQARLLREIEGLDALSGPVSPGTAVVPVRPGRLGPLWLGAAVFLGGLLLGLAAVLWLGR